MKAGMLARNAVLAAMLSTPVATASGALAQDAEGFEWQSFQFNDPAAQAVPGSRLVYGVPETDNAQVAGTCLAGTNTETASVVFAADTGGTASGEFVQVRFIGEGFNEVYPATVFVPESGEGVYGVSLEIGFEDPLWEALRSLATIGYSVNGGAFLNVGLSGSSKAINGFLDGCRSYAGFPATDTGPGTGTGLGTGAGNAAQPLSPPPQTTSDPRWASCEALANATSLNSDTAVDVTFVNRTQSFRALMWIGYDGVAVNYANLNPGEQYSVRTYLTHPWMVTDGPGNCIEMIMPQQGVNVIDITAPDRYFGPE